LHPLSALCSSPLAVTAERDTLSVSHSRSTSAPTPPGQPISPARCRGCPSGVQWGCRRHRWCRGCWCRGWCRSAVLARSRAGRAYDDLCFDSTVQLSPDGQHPSPPDNRNRPAPRLGCRSAGLPAQDWLGLCLSERWRELTAASTPRHGVHRRHGPRRIALRRPADPLVAGGHRRPCRSPPSTW
jgi:hypothetical protein